MISEKIQNLSAETLRATNAKIAAHQRKVDAIFVEHLAETIKRKAFIDWGFSSIYDYLTTELKFSGSSANHRIQAAYALIQVPEIKQDLERGSLSLSQVCSVQTAIRQEQKVNGRIPVQEKRDLFAEVRNTSARETEKILDRKFESVSQSLPIEKHKHDDSVVVTVRFSKEEYEILTRSKELNSHSIPDGNWKELIVLLAKRDLQKRDPQLRKLVKVTTNAEPKAAQCGTDAAVKFAKTKPLPKPATRSIRPTVRRYVFQRDRVCQFKHLDGRLCGSKHQLEIDHIQPVFAGGSSESENLRLLCRAHNLYRYVRGR